MRTLNIGIVGFGYMGKMHALAYENLRYYYNMGIRVHLYAVVTKKDPEDLPVAFDVIYRDYREMIEDEKVDIVDICTPNDMHREILIAAIEHGKYIYCEKPLGVNRADADAVMSAMTRCRYDRTNRMTFEYRFVPAVMRAKQIIDAGEIGALIQMNCKYYGSEFLNPNRPVSWQSTGARAGGGVLYALGTHAIDLIRYLTGEIRDVSARKRTYYSGRPRKDHPEERVPVDTEDIVNVQFTGENGLMGTLLLSQVAAGAGVDFSFEVYGESGALKFDQSNPNHLLYYRDADPKQPVGGFCGYKAIECAQKYGKEAVFPPERVNISWIRYHIASIYDFIHGIETETAVHPDLADGYRVQCITDAIYRSCDTGKAEEV